MTSRGMPDLDSTTHTGPQRQSGRSHVSSVESLIKLPFLWCGKSSGLGDDNGDNLNDPRITPSCPQGLLVH